VLQEPETATRWEKWPKDSIAPFDQLLNEIERAVLPREIEEVSRCHLSATLGDAVSLYEQNVALSEMTLDAHAPTGRMIALETR
jgi:hypothetical protein